MTKIAILGEYNADFPPHPATSAAILHSCKFLDAETRGVWVSTEHARLEALQEYAGIWVAPGSPYKNFSNTLRAIRYARENGIPCFGTCGGFQHIVIEYARNVLGYKVAHHAEYDPYASNLFVSSLACSLAGRKMKLKFVPGSGVAEIYGSLEVEEQYYCNFGVNPDVVELLMKAPLQIVGSDSEGEIRVVELPHHPFFIATLFVPQLLSRPDCPHPLITAFIGKVVSEAIRVREQRIVVTG